MQAAAGSREVRGRAWRSFSRPRILHDEAARVLLEAGLGLPRCGLSKIRVHSDLRCVWLKALPWIKCCKIQSPGGRHTCLICTKSCRAYGARDVLAILSHGDAVG